MAERLCAGNVGARAARQRDRHRRRAGRASSCLRAAIGRAYEPGRDTCRRARPMACGGMPCRPTSPPRSSAPSSGCCSPISCRPAAAAAVDRMPAPASRNARRGRRNLRPALGHLGLSRASTQPVTAFAGRGLHHRRLLVHRLDLLRQPRRDSPARSTDTFAGIRPVERRASSSRSSRRSLLALPCCARAAGTSTVILSGTAR